MAGGRQRIFAAINSTNTNFSPRLFQPMIQRRFSVLRSVSNVIQT